MLAQAAGRRRRSRRRTSTQSRSGRRPQWLSFEPLEGRRLLAITDPLLGLTAVYSQADPANAARFGNAVTSDECVKDSDQDDLVMTANGPPTVVNPIDDVTVDEDAANTVIDLGPVFTDPDLGWATR